MAVAAGLRHPSSGALTNVGTWGAYYGSSSFAAGNPNASHLAFGSGEVNPLNTANRANALSVRCVQHLRLLFFFVGFSAVTRARSAHPSGPYPRRSRPIQ